MNNYPGPFRDREEVKELLQNHRIFKIALEMSIIELEKDEKKNAEEITKRKEKLQKLELLKQSVDRLPPKEYSIITMMYYGSPNFTINDLSLVLDKPPRTADDNLRKALNKLYGMLQTLGLLCQA